MRIPLLALGAVCALLALPSASSAAPYMVSVMQDDNQLTYGTPKQRRVALDRMKGLGVEAVRVTMLWRVIAPAGQSRRKPSGFNGANPAAYPRANWDRFDDLVAAAQQRGMVVYFNPTGAGPLWANGRTKVKARRTTWKPDPEEYRKFVIAAGRRYSGTYRDETGARALLPRVSWWSIFNEPNQPGWLAPQSEERPGVGLIPMSPHLYRGLLIAGAKALAASGHRDDLVLIGETAPLGEVKRRAARLPLRPGVFLRELFCLDRGYRPFAGRQAAARGCGNLDGLEVLEQFPRLGFGHHPYTKKLAPTRRDKGPDAMTMGNIDDLPRALDKIAARTGLLPEGMPVFLTEYGYETNPPDPYTGIAPALQAQYLNEGDYIAWKHPRIFSNTQFQLFDVPPRDDFPRDSQLYWFTYQSGLYTAEPAARPKPAAAAYAFPLVARRKGGTATIWGQVRFTPNGASQLVTLQTKLKGSRTWTRSGAPFEVADNQGYFEVTRPTSAGALWRAIWIERDFSSFRVSREALVG